MTSAWPKCSDRAVLCSRVCRVCCVCGRCELQIVGLPFILVECVAHVLDLVVNVFADVPYVRWLPLCDAQCVWCNPFEDRGHALESFTRHVSAKYEKKTTLNRNETEGETCLTFPIYLCMLTFQAISWCHSCLWSNFSHFVSTKRAASPFMAVEKLLDRVGGHYRKHQRQSNGKRIVEERKGSK